ncbi:MAG: 16S rRNA (cytidine(1402)-2'-O)-methyltransferase [Tissierellaceae bacterium]|nr:16S rRNA (cytidine(1402)-2'-O)-methyltransferase [Tissierellaceae bacterium]
MDKGTLYICPTPIGNLEDITLRTLNILKEADLIAAEDTRHTLKLLNYYNIKKPLISYHEHNKRERGEKVIKEIIEGKRVALVSDAGMPCIQDPGEDLIKLAIEKEIQIVALPGASAFILALVLSGFPTDKFVFEGFLSSSKKGRIKDLNRIRDENRTIILYEAPHRFLDLMEDIIQVLGDRKISVSRELTKIHEETFRGKVSEGIKKFKEEGVKGELVIILEGKKEEEKNFDDLPVKEHIKQYMREGLSKKEAVKKVAKERKLPRNQIYKEGINIEDK